ncbi:DUF397 domain-containing protein [Streptomyces xiamenensis]
MDSCAWQKSSFSAEAGNCLNVGAGSDGTALFRESDDPGTVLSTNPRRLSALLGAVKRGPLVR